MFDIAALMKLFQGASAGAGAAGGGNPMGMLGGSGMMGGAGGPAGPAAPSGLLGGAMGGGAPAPQQMAPTPPPQQASAIPSAPSGGGFMDKFAMNTDGGRFLMNMGAGMMQSGAPSLDPRSGSFLGAVGNGLQAGNSAVGEGQDRDAKRKLVEAQVGNYGANTASTQASTDIARQQQEAAQAIFASQGSPMANTPQGAQMAAPAPSVESAPLPPVGGGDVNVEGSVNEAKQAIAAGAPREVVLQRLQANGINPAEWGF